MPASPSARAKPATFAELPRLLASAPHRLLFLEGTIAVMPSMTWLCFGLLQGVALLRIRAAFGGDVYLWLVLAARGWLLALLPWVLRSAWIFLTPRLDGKPG